MGGSLGTLATAVVEIKGDQSKFVRDLTRTKSLMNGFDQQAMAMTRNIGVAFVGMGVAVGAGLTVALSTFSQFEQTMTNVAAVANATAQEFEQLSDFAKEMGETTVFSARQAGDAMYFLASAGLAVEEQMETTNAVMELAAATQSELAEAAQLTVNSIKAFGLATSESDRVVNVFAAAISSSQATLGKLAIALPFISTQFNQLDFSIETTTAALSLLIDRGLRSSMAATRLRGAMQKLLRVTPQLEKGLAKIGLTIEDVNPVTHDLVDIVRTFEEAGLDAATAAQIFGARSEGMTVLVSAGADALEEMTAKITGTSRATEMAARQLDTLNGDMRLLKSAAEGAAISIGEALAPAARGLLQTITAMIGRFNDLSPALKSFTAKSLAAIAGITAISGVTLILISQLPKLVGGVVLLSGALDTLRLKAWAAGTSLSAILGTAGLIAVGTGLIWAGFRAIKSYNREARRWVETQIELGVTMTEINGKMVDLRDLLNNTEPSITAIIDRYGAANTALMTFGRGNDDVVDKSGATAKAMEETTKKINEEKRALANLTKITRDNISAILHASIVTGSWAVDIDKMTTALANLGTTEKAYSKLKAKGIEDLEEGYDTFFNDLNKFYETSSLNDLQYWRGVREQGRLTVDALRFVNRQIQIAGEETYGAQKIGLDAVTVKEREEFKKRLDAVFEFSGKVSKSGQRRFAADKEAAEKRLKTEADINARLGNITEGFNAKVVGEQELNLSVIQANTAAFQHETEAELDEHNQEIVRSIGVKNAAVIVEEADLYDQLQLGILKFHAFELDQQDAKIALLLREYKEIKALFEKHGGDMIALENWKNDKLLKIQAEHQGFFRRIVTDGVSALAGELRPAVQNLFEAIFSPDINMDDFLKTLKRNIIQKLSQVATSTIFALAKKAGRELMSEKEPKLPDDLKQAEDVTLSLSGTMNVLSGSADNLTLSINSATAAIHEYTAAAAEAGLLEALAEITTLDPGREYAITSRAAGGIVTSPEVAVIGDTPYGEAYIPLPRGGKVPVEMAGDRGGGSNILIERVVFELPNVDFRTISDEDVAYLVDGRFMPAIRSSLARGF